MKTTLISIFILIICAATVTAADLNLLENNLNTTVEPGTRQTLQFSIKNEGTKEELYAKIKSHFN